MKHDNNCFLKVLVKKIEAQILSVLVCNDATSEWKNEACNMVFQLTPGILEGHYNLEV